MSATMGERVLALCDGKLTQAEIAARVGCSYPYVSVVLQRNEARGGPMRSVKREKTGPKQPAAEENRLPSVRHMVLVDGATYRALRDRAAAQRLTFDEVAGRVLAAAIRAGVMDETLPIGGGR
jgi:hypothetical protein